MDEYLEGINKEVEAEDSDGNRRRPPTEKELKFKAESIAATNELIKKRNDAVKAFYDKNKDDRTLIDPEDPFWWKFREKDPITDKAKLDELIYKYNNRSWDHYIKS